MLQNEFGIAEIKALWLSRIEISGMCFTSIFSVFSIMAGWIVEILLYYSLLILLCNGWNIAECVACWLMGVPIINPYVARFMSYSSYFL